MGFIGLGEKFVLRNATSFNSIFLSTKWWQIYAGRHDCIKKKKEKALCYELNYRGKRRIIGVKTDMETEDRKN